MQRRPRSSVPVPRPSPHRRSSPLIAGALVALLVGACSANGSATGGTPAAAADAASSAPQATSYPGWPDPGNVTTTGNLVPILVSSELAVGKNRFLLGLADAKNNLLAAPDMAVHLRFYDLAADPAKPVTETDGTFVWAVPNQRGLYTSNVTFNRAGDWGVEVSATKAGGAPQSVRVAFQVATTTHTPAIGAPAPASDTPYLKPGVTIDQISTDPHPDPGFYRLSIRQALAAHQPFVVVFATPKFCTSQVCGPTLNNVKSVSAAFAGRVNFIHVEVYTNLSDPNNLKLVPAVQQWGLPSEPWVFVVDAQGKIADKFEGICPPDELSAAIKATLS